jgi:hypothetical protein
MALCTEIYGNWLPSIVPPMAGLSTDNILDEPGFFKIVIKTSQSYIFTPKIS